MYSSAINTGFIRSTSNLTWIPNMLSRSAMTNVAAVRGLSNFLSPLILFLSMQIPYHAGGFDAF